MKLIEVADLSKQFVREKKKREKELFFAVEHMNFHAEAGEIVGVLGPNGAGKTTLLRMLGGIMQPTEGEVHIYDKNNCELPDKNERKEHIGYLSENTKLYKRFSVREMLTIFGELYGFSAGEISVRLEEISELLQMEEFMDNRIAKLSTGQMQRTSIARCLIHNPEIYIFDEPTLGLDIISSKSIIEFMKRERDNGKCVIYSTHYMEEAEYLCDRILMISQGKIMAEGTAEQLKKDTQTTNLRDTFFALMEREGGGEG